MVPLLQTGSKLNMSGLQAGHAPEPHPPEAAFQVRRAVELDGEGVEVPLSLRRHQLRKI